MVKMEVVRYHEKLGYRVNRMEQSSELSTRLLPGLAESGIPLFTEDGLIQLEVAVMADIVSEAAVTCFQPYSL